MRGLAAVMALAVMAAACIGEEEPSTTVAGSAEGPGGRLAVVEADGGLKTMSPDGTEVVQLADGAEGLARQPTWSPDGELLAWTTVGNDAAAGVAVAAGSEVERVAVPFAPFYYAWDPTSTRLAFLGSGATELELWVAETEPLAARALDVGQPFYLSWSPEGDELLVHVEASRLALLDLDGERTELFPAEGFQAPIWLADGRWVFAASGVVLAGGVRDHQSVVGFDGFITFVASPDGERLAYRALSTGQDAQTVARRAQGVEARPGRLAVVGIDGEGATELTSEAVVAFFWSPDSSRLLFLEVADADEGLFQWRVWDGSDVTDHARFRPSTTTGRDYLPFFDQYAQSIRLWSPDSTAFTYAGRAEDGTAGVWVQSLQGSAEQVAEGVFSVWSPVS